MCILVVLAVEGYMMISVKQSGRTLSSLRLGDVWPPVMVSHSSTTWLVDIPVKTLVCSRKYGVYAHGYIQYMEPTVVSAMQCMRLTSYGTYMRILDNHNAHTHTRTHTHTHTHTRTHAHTHARTHAHMHTRTHTYMHTRTHAHTHTHTHTHTRTRTLVCTRTHPYEEGFKARTRTLTHTSSHSTSVHVLKETLVCV